MSELKKCGICGAVSIRKDGHIFHKTDDCIRNLEARILELHSKISRLIEAGDKLTDPIYWSVADDCFVCIYCGEYELQRADVKHATDCPVTLWQKVKEEK